MNISQYLDEASKKSTLLNIVGPFCDKNASFSEPVVYVDSGAKFRSDEIGFSAGDGDSFSGELDEKLSPEKSFSDLAYVFYAINENFKQINLYGFLGGRRDHELINLAEAHQFLKSRKKSIRLSFEDKVIALSEGDWTENINGVFSVFLFEDGKVRLSGNCKYKVTDNSFQPLSSHGLSNEGYGEVSMECNIPVFLFL